MLRQMPKASPVIPFLLSLSVGYSELTEIKMFTGITLAQSLHVGCVISIGLPSWFKTEIFPTSPSPRIENVPNRDTTVSYRTEP